MRTTSPPGVETFRGLFRRRDASIYRPRTSDSWLGAPADRTISDHDIGAALAGRSDRLLGFRWDAVTQYAVLDVDSGSPYHNPAGLRRLRLHLRRVGLDPILYRSSQSGGWHLYLPFLSLVDSQEVRRHLAAYLRASGFALRAGTLELFPSGNGLRMPLQAGWGWLSPTGRLRTPIERLTVDRAVERFVNDLTVHAVDWDGVAARISNKIIRMPQTADGKLEQAHQGGAIDQARWLRGRRYWLEGLTGSGQLHDAIMSLGHYLWFGDRAVGLVPLMGSQQADRRAELITCWVDEKHNSKSRTINRGKRRSVELNIRAATRWVGTPQITRRTPYLLTERLTERLIEVEYCTVDDFQTANLNRVRGARAKIVQALKRLIDEKQQVTQGELVRSSGCSVQTVRRHRDLWASYHFDNSARTELLATVQGDNIRCIDPPTGPIGDGALAICSIAQPVGSNLMISSIPVDTRSIESGEIRQVDIVRSGDCRAGPDDLVA